MRTFYVLIVSVVFAHANGQGQKSAKQALPIEVRMSADKPQYSAGESIRVKVELLNRTNETILVGRDMPPIDNWPFHTSLTLTDSNGGIAQSINSGFVDPPPIPDLSQRGGVLRWWITLDPGTSYAKELYFPIQTSVRPGHFQLRGKYVSVGLPDGQQGHYVERREATIPAFKGNVTIAPVDIEIVGGSE